MTNLDKELKNTKSKSLTSNPNSKFVSNYKRKKKLEEEQKKDRALSIFFDVCTYFGVKWVDVLNPYRGPKYVKIRKISSYLIREKTGLAFGKIGELLKIDRTSANHNYILAKKIHKDPKESDTQKDINNILLIIL